MKSLLRGRVKQLALLTVASVFTLVLVDPAGAYAQSRNHQRIVIGAGDSFTSGQGIPPFIAGTDTTTDKCHRSEAAYPLVAAKIVGAKGLNVACSGAQTKDLFTVYKSEQPQVSRIGKATDVVVTIGGNDINALASITNPPTPEQVATSLKALLPNLVKTYQDLQAANPQARIYAVGYPSLFSIAPVPGCPLSQTQRLGIVAMTKALDLTIQLAATKADVEFVNTFNAFADHELCTAQPWVNGLNLIHPEYSLHPTSDGQHALGERVAESLQTHRCHRFWF